MIEVIQPFLAPAVMFSAGGLLCLAQFGRFNAILGQIRSLNRERLAVLQEVARAEPSQQDLLNQRAQGLEQQVETILSHAVTVKNALRLLVSGILLMVLCSLTIGASLLFPFLAAAVVAIFVLGLALTFSGLCLVLFELGISLKAINFEHENLVRLRHGEGLLPTDIRQNIESD